MNLFFRELKSHRNSLIFWAIGMVFLVGSGMAKYGAYQTTGQSMNEILSQFPRAVQIIFGISGFDLSRASGYFGLLFMYISLMGTIHAVLLGTDMLSKEERDRTSEFLFVRPVARTTIITAKLLAGFLNLVLFNLITSISSIYFVNYYSNGEAVNKEIMILMTGLFFLQLIYFSIGTIISGINKKPKVVSGIATSILMVTFILSFLINLKDKLSFLKYLTPFKYFDARELMINNRLDPIFIVISCFIIVVMIAGTYIFYSRRDLNV